MLDPPFTAFPLLKCVACSKVLVRKINPRGEGVPQKNLLDVCRHLLLHNDQISLRETTLSLPFRIYVLKGVSDYILCIARV